jgi:flavorubredoxin
VCRIDPVADGIFRISAFAPEVGISFNQFLIVDEQSALIHTGTHPMYDAVRKAVAEVMDPAKLAYVVVPHFEADECGGMGRFVEGSPKSTLICSDAGAMLNFSAWDYRGPFKGMREGERIELGRHTLRFIETPHVHHWDSMMVYEELTGSVFPADLFIQPGEQPPIVRENLGAAMCELYRMVGIFAAREPVLDAVRKIEKLPLNWVHPMHGGSLSSETFKGFSAALRERPFIYEGKIFGRSIS